MGSTKKPKHEPSPRCTACDKDLKHAKDGEVKTHALLNVLVCLKCSENYGDGDFTKYDNGVDEEGDDNYCRWCADGGELLVCCDPNCHYAYCKKCIKRNLGRKIYGKISDSEDWHCFACDKTQIEDWINYAKEFIVKLQSTEKENEKPIPATPEVTTSDPPKTSVLITPSVDASFTSSARKKEARAKKSTAKPARIFEEKKEDDDTKSSDKADDNMSEASENKTDDVEKDQEKEEKKEEKIDTEKETNLDTTQELKPEPEENFNSTNKTSTPSRSSPRRVSKMFSDVVVEESDGDQQKTPKRKLCDDVVIEDDDDLFEHQKKEATVEKNTPKPKLGDGKVLSTTIEKASDDSGDEISTDSKRKTKNVPNSDIKKRRITRGSVAGVNGDTKMSEVNSMVNDLIQDTNEITTEYFKILAQMRDSSEISDELHEKFKEISSKIHVKINENIWTIRGMNH